MALRIPDRKKVQAFRQLPSGWRVFVMKQKTSRETTVSFLWFTVKIMAPAGTPGRKLRNPEPGQLGYKRTYLLAWNPIEQRLSSNSNFRHFQATQPEVVEEVRETLAELLPPDCLLEHYSPEEIAAERKFRGELAAIRKAFYPKAREAAPEGGRHRLIVAAVASAADAIRCGEDASEVLAAAEAAFQAERAKNDRILASPAPKAKEAARIAMSRAEQERIVREELGL